MSIQQTILKNEFNGMLQSGTVVSLTYKALQGTHPKDFGYFVALWEGDQIQDIKSAKQTKPISLNDQAGSLEFSGLNITSSDYIIGLGVNNSDGSKSICSTLSIPSSVGIGEPLSGVTSDVSLPTGFGSHSVTAHYVTPLYNTPMDNSNWIGLFLGSFTSNMFRGINVIQTADVSSNIASGLAVMNNIKGGLIRFQKYTLVYGMGIDYNTGEPNFQTIVSAVEFNA